MGLRRRAFGDDRGSLAAPQGLPLIDPSEVEVRSCDMREECQRVVRADHHTARRLSVFVDQDVYWTGTGTNDHGYESGVLPPGSSQFNAGERDHQNEEGANTEASEKVHAADVRAGARV